MTVSFNVAYFRNPKKEKEENLELAEKFIKDLLNLAKKINNSPGFELNLWTDISAYSLLDKAITTDNIKFNKSLLANTAIYDITGLNTKEKSEKHKFTKANLAKKANIRNLTEFKEQMICTFEQLTKNSTPDEFKDIKYTLNHIAAIKDRANPAVMKDFIEYLVLNKITTDYGVFSDFDFCRGYIKDINTPLQEPKNFPKSLDALYEYTNPECMLVKKNSQFMHIMQKYIVENINQALSAPQLFISSNNKAHIPIQESTMDSIINRKQSDDDFWNNLAVKYNLTHNGSNTLHLYTRHCDDDTCLQFKSKCTLFSNDAEENTPSRRSLTNTIIIKNYSGSIIYTVLQQESQDRDIAKLERYKIDNNFRKQIKNMFGHLLIHENRHCDMSFL